MRLAILTFTYGENIGQRLQNYALQEILTQRGHDVYTLIQKQPLLKVVLKNIKESVIDIKERRWHSKKISKKIFADFNYKNIRFYHSPITFYHGVADIYGIKIPYHGNWKYIDTCFDGFIVGSDQVWSPVSSDVGDTFFLTFTSRDKRFNYAPSLSAETIPEDRKADFRDKIDGFNIITVREDKGAQLIYELIGEDVNVVLDPTLLLNRTEWNKIKKAYKYAPQNKYIISMFLGEEPEQDVQKIGKTLNLAVYSIKKPICISPDEFLYVIEHADLVLTDSYHVTVFSIIYHIPFINFTRQSGESMNSRFETLYRFTGIKGRFWNDLKEQYDNWLNLDFTSIDDEIEKNKKMSISWLQKQGL